MIYRAAWICPITQPPIREGWVAVSNGRIAAVGPSHVSPPAGKVRDLGAVAVLPGLINAHTHLELSWLRGRVPPAASFDTWITQMLITRGGRREKPGDAAVVEPARAAVRELREYGVAAVGDISNSLASVDPLRDEGMRAVVFHELIGFGLAHRRRVEDTREARAAAAARGNDTVKISVAPHACYSVSADLFRAIRVEVDTGSTPITSVHVGESDGEMQFLADGTGPVPTMLKWLGAWVDGWQPPRCGPVEFLDSLQMLDAHTLVVHGVQLSDQSLARLASIGCTLVTCPRSNQWVGVGVPPIARFYASGVPIAVGTDSLASVEDLSVFAELTTMRWLAPSVPARALLESATLVGARALGFGDQLGSLDPGKLAELIAVDIKGHVVDVEEYLVSGIDPRQIAWVAE